MPVPPRPSREPQPVNSNSILQSSLDDLTRQLSTLNDFLQEQAKKDKETINFRTAQDQQFQKVTGRTPLLTAAERVRRATLPQYQTLPQDQGSQLEMDVDPRLPPDTDERAGHAPPSRHLNQSDLQLLRKRAQARGFIKALGSFKGRDHNNASLPPDALDTSGASEDPILGDTGRNAPSNDPNPGGGPNGQGLSQRDAITWGILGEHGGPSIIRNLALEQYGFKRSIDWATNTASQLSNVLGSENPSAMQSVLQKIPGVNQNNLDAMGGFLNIAKNNPGLAFAAYKGIQLGARGLGAMGADMRDNQALGQQFGYGPPAIGGQTILGFHNPLGNLGTAAQVGAAFHVEQQALQGRIPGAGFGNGLSGKQAHDVMGTLGGQGFAMQPIAGGGIPGAVSSTLSSIPGIGGPLAGLLDSFFGSQPQGDAANIAQNFMRPLMQKFPGVSAADLGEFTPALRNSGTSIQQLTDQLSNLGIEAKATKETVGQFTTSVAQTGQSFEAMGSSLQGGVAIGTGFTNATAIDPQIASKFGQSPLVQGLALSRYGILPSGLGDMNSGAFTNTSLASLQMLQKATAGLNQDKYKTVNGHQVLIQSGQQAQYDQIAQMTGLPSNIVKRMLGDQSGIAARANAMSMVGDPTSSTGIWAMLNANGGKKLNDKQYNAANKVWHDTIDNTWQGTGIGKKKMDQIDHISGLRDRAKAYQGALADASNKDSWNQIQNNPNTQTVKVQFTGAAAKFFMQAGPSANKQAANAGGISIGSVANSLLGDIPGSPVTMVKPFANLISDILP